MDNEQHENLVAISNEIATGKKPKSNRQIIITLRDDIERQIDDTKEEAKRAALSHENAMRILDLRETKLKAEYSRLQTYVEAAR